MYVCFQVVTAVLIRQFQPILNSSLFAVRAFSPSVVFMFLTQQYWACHEKFYAMFLINSPLTLSKNCQFFKCFLFCFILFCCSSSSSVLALVGVNVHMAIQSNQSINQFCLFLLTVLPFVTCSQTDKKIR